MEVTEIQFTRSGDVNLAYQRWGSGPDVVLIPPLVLNIEMVCSDRRFQDRGEHTLKGVDGAWRLYELVH